MTTVPLPTELGYDPEDVRDVLVSTFTHLGVTAFGIALGVAIFAPHVTSVCGLAVTPNCAQLAHFAETMQRIPALVGFLLICVAGLVETKADQRVLGRATDE